MLAFGPFQLHPEQRELRRDGALLPLRSSAFEILCSLAEQPGAVVSKRALCERAWPLRDVDENNLQVEVSALRKLLGRSAIVTASGRGYQFTLTVDRLNRNASMPERLFGRDADVAALRAMLAPGALVSVVGEGGIGKTRVARAVAAGSALACEVSLDAVTDAPGLVRAVSTAMALPAGARSPAELAAWLHDWPGLLLLDTCDHALQAVAELAGALMIERGRAALLLTSREALRMPAEQVYRLGVLDAEAARAVFTDAWQCQASTPDEAAAVQMICRRLDGHPLALSIAGRRARADGIHRALLPPDRSPSISPARHADLAASLAWSWQGLSADDQALLRALIDAPTPFGLALLPTLALEPALRDWERVDLLARLADKSLVTVAPGAGSDVPVYAVSAATRIGLRALLGGT